MRQRFGPRLSRFQASATPQMTAPAWHSSFRASDILQRGPEMIRRLGEKLRYFWRRTNHFLLAMDVDPLEDIHRRLRELEAANSAPKVNRYRTKPSGSIQEVDADL